MADLPKRVRVAVIGGGAVGASVIYHLAIRGWSDCILLEKNELSAGSTWHAAGNVPTFSSSWSILNMQRYSAELYRDLGEKVDYPMNYHVTGSIRLGHSEERIQEFRRVLGMGRYQGMELELLSPEEIKKRYPFIETHDIKGALYDPADGDIDPSQLTQALAKGAKDLGARVERFCPVEGASWQGDHWLLSTPKGELEADYIVNAAGYYAAEVGKMFNRKVPMMVMSHQYILFEEIEELKSWSQSEGKKLPLLRDVDSSYYLRQEKYGMNLGPYEGNCRAHWHEDHDPMPDDFSFQLFPDDLERIEWHLNDACARVPILGKAGLSKVINGPIPYTPDGYPLLGPMPGVPNAFEACVFTFGICQGGGAGKVMAEYIIDGGTEWDMWSCDPRRFTGFIDDDYCIAKGMEVYGHEYAVHFPYHEWPAGRNKRQSALHDKITALGGQMGAYNGWERANWFAKTGDDTSEEATQTFSRNGPWQKRIEEECLNVTNHVGVLDLPGFSRFSLKGEGAGDWLLSLIAGRLPKIGRLNLGYFPDHRGRIVTEMSLIRHDEDDFTLITAAAAEWHDYELLRQALPADGRLSLENISESLSTLIIAGPNSRDLLSGLSDGDLSLPWLSHQQAFVAGKQAMLMRVSFAGELGWEVHAKPDDMPVIYDALLSAGAKPFGMYALNSMRVEKGYRAWKGDLSTDYSLLQAKLDRFIDFNKNHDFPGKQALLDEKHNGIHKSFAILEIDCMEYEAPYMSTIWMGDEVIGESTSGAYGYRVGKNLALAMIKPDYAQAGTKVKIELFNHRYDAVVLGDVAPFDAKNERLRS